jgi:hypothetical protein
MDFRVTFEPLGVIPEPASAVLLATGLMGLLTTRRRRCDRRDAPA